MPARPKKLYFSAFWQGQDSGPTGDWTINDPDADCFSINRRCSWPCVLEQNSSPPGPDLALVLQIPFDKVFRPQKTNSKYSLSLGVWSCRVGVQCPLDIPFDSRPCLAMVQRVEVRGNKPRKSWDVKQPYFHETQWMAREIVILFLMAIPRTERGGDEYQSGPSKMQIPDPAMLAEGSRNNNHSWYGNLAATGSMGNVACHLVNWRSITVNHRGKLFTRGKSCGASTLTLPWKNPHVE